MVFTRSGLHALRRQEGVGSLDMWPRPMMQSSGSHDLLIPTV